MKFKQKYFKTPKWISFIKNKCGKIKFHFQNTFGPCNKGSIIASAVISSCVTAGIVRTFYPATAWFFCFVLGFAGAVLISELFGLILRLFSGVNKRNRTYWFIMFCAALANTFIASQLTNVGEQCLFSLVAAIIVDLFGRSLWAVLRNKKRNLTDCSILGITAAVLILFGFFLGSKGFKMNSLDQYVSMAEHAACYQTQLDSTLDSNPGSSQVMSYTYGSEEQSHTVDLSKMAERSFLTASSKKHYFDYDLTEVPLTGKVWYPKDQTDCPVMFLIHGNHNYTTESYLGYEYLGEYLASFGYVVISVDENSCNDLNQENDARAYLLLENMKYVFELNQNENSELYHKMNPKQVAIAGHSRGGEAVATAYLFNEYTKYPEDGNITFDFHFNIQSIITIAPTVDQYQPAEHAVALKDVNYLLLHGSNDNDVSVVMGEKQYANVTFSGEKECIKSMLYIGGANHGQFNTEWGAFDLAYPVNYFLNVANLLPEDEQQKVLCLYTKVFLDVTLRGDNQFKDLLTDYKRYADVLPETVYQQVYQTSSFTCLSDFEEDSDLSTATMHGAGIQTTGMKMWKEGRRVQGNNTDGENYVLNVSWQDTKEAAVTFTLTEYDMTEKSFVFDIADLTEEKKAGSLLDGTVELTDAEGNTATAQISHFNIVYPTLLLQLRKLDYVFGEYEYKHQYQNVTIPNEEFTSVNGQLDCSKVVKISILFDTMEDGKISIDHVGFEG